MTPASRSTGGRTHARACVRGKKAAAGLGAILAGMGLGMGMSKTIERVLSKPSGHLSVTIDWREEADRDD